MSGRAPADRDPLSGMQQLDRMLRVSPLTIGAVYKKADRVGQGYILNLSRGGIFLSASESFALGERLRVRFFLPFQLGQVDTVAEVRWRTQDLKSPPPQLRSGFGLEFVEIDPSVQDKIGQFIDKFVALADQLED